MVELRGEEIVSYQAIVKAQQNKYVPEGDNLRMNILSLLTFEGLALIDGA